MKLYLAQHGEACGKDIDPGRPLTDQGREDIERLAEFLGRAGIEVERVIDSGKLRAAQTADLLAAALAPMAELETNDRIDSNDDPRAFGHLPFLARLVSLLVVEDLDRPIAAYQPGSVVCLELDTDGHWQINWMIRPHLLG